MALALLVVVWLEWSLCVAAMACALPGRRSDAVGALRRAQYLVLRAVAAKPACGLPSVLLAASHCNHHAYPVVNLAIAR